MNRLLCVTAAIVTGAVALNAQTGAPASKFDAAMRCEAKNGSQPMTMAVNGTYSPDSYQTHVSMNVEGGPQGAMSMKMRSEAHRVGECSAKELKEAKG